MTDQIVLINVLDALDGEMDLSFHDGQPDQAVPLLVLETEVTYPGDKPGLHPMTICIPASTGPDLIRALLTDAQWEAVLEA